MTETTGLLRRSRFNSNRDHESTAARRMRDSEFTATTDQSVAQPYSQQLRSSVSVAAADIVIAGGGPVGIRAAQEFARLGHSVVLFNAERWQPYNRVKLTPLLSGEVQLGKIYLPEQYPGPGSVKRYDGVSVVDVDRFHRKVLTSTDKVLGYKKLVLALGSRAFVPDIPGAGLDGVFTFRNFDDTEALLARSLSARNIVVIGGGLLGLEAARGMRQRGATVTVVEHENRLMPRQLDDHGAQLLRHQIESLGLSIRTATRVNRIEGVDRVESVTVANGETIAADSVIICTGTRPNIQLPSAIGLEYGRGVRVNDKLRTNDPNIYAIGECAEHNNHVYGLVGPGFEQATFVAQHISRLLNGSRKPETSRFKQDRIPGKLALSYKGSVPASKLKILGIDIFSMGDYESIEQNAGIKSYQFEDSANGLYRHLLVSNNKIVSAIGVGQWPDASAVQQLITTGKRCWWWQISLFKRHGTLTRHATHDSVESKPRSAIICSCTGTSKGAICDAITLGASSVEAVRSSTGANTVCGSCSVDISRLLGQPLLKPESVNGWRAVLIASGIAMLIAVLTVFTAPIPLNATFEPDELLRHLWFDSTIKQWTGYSLLGLSVTAALIGLRKRIAFLKRLGSYDSWRVFHLMIGVLITFALFAHTGFRLGANLNFWLMASFLTCLFFGALSGLLTGSEHKLKEHDAIAADSRPRTLPTWIHILAIWPLPVLLMVHILMVYTY